jgi:cation diffusion facilitator family transporter
MLITLIVNIAVMIYEYRRGKKLQSDILVIDSMHTRADIFTSISVIVALVVVKLGFPIIDPIVTFVVSCFIAYSAFEIIRQESGILCDAVAITDTNKIKNIVLGINGVKNCHRIRTRGRLDDVHLDLHVEVDGNKTMRDSHHLSHTIQKEITKKFPEIVDIIVHMEPVPIKEEKTKQNFFRG